MQDYFENRCLNAGWYMYENQATVRQTAAAIGISKTTVYKDLTQRLPMYSSVLAREVQKILEQNKNERHIRGGFATKRKYSMKK